MQEKLNKHDLHIICAAACCYTVRIHKSLICYGSSKEQEGGLILIRFCDLFNCPMIMILFSYRIGFKA